MRHVSPVALAAIFAASVSATWALLGGMALAFLLPAWLLVFAWRFDNHTGSLLLLAILFLMVIAIMVGLIALMALHR